MSGIKITPPTTNNYQIFEINPTFHQRENLMEYSKLVRQNYPNAKNGDIVISCPNNSRFHNDCTYHYVHTESINDVCVLPFTVSDIDDYGHCNSLLKVREDEPINMYCMMNSHNNYWWPSDELRNAIKMTERHKIDIQSENIEYVDITSDDYTFRFIITNESDIDNGIFEYIKDEYSSPRGTFFIDAYINPKTFLCVIHKEPKDSEPLLEGYDCDDYCDDDEGCDYDD